VGNAGNDRGIFVLGRERRALFLALRGAFGRGSFSLRLLLGGGVRLRLRLRLRPLDVWARQKEDKNQPGGKARAFAQLMQRSSPNSLRRAVLWFVGVDRPARSTSRRAPHAGAGPARTLPAPASATAAARKVPRADR